MDSTGAKLRWLKSFEQVAVKAGIHSDRRVSCADGMEHGDRREKIEPREAVAPTPRDRRIRSSAPSHAVAAEQFDDRLDPGHLQSLASSLMQSFERRLHVDGRMRHDRFRRAAFVIQMGRSSFKLAMINTTPSKTCI